MIFVDENSKMSFLRNEFSDIFEGLFTMMLFPTMNYTNDQTKIQKIKAEDIC